MISIDGSGGKDGAPASWAVIVLANDGHLQFKPYTAFCRIVFLELSNVRALEMLVAIISVEGTARRFDFVVGHCQLSWTTILGCL